MGTAREGARRDYRGRGIGGMRVARAGALLAFATGCVVAGVSSRGAAGASSALAVAGVSAVHFPSRSGSELHAWFAPGRSGAGAVLLLHGVGADRSAMLSRAEFLHAAGFAVLAPDFQGQGESPGRHVTYGALESLDAAAALAYLREHAPGERVGVIGVSMGGAAALLGPGPLDADAFVLESVYPTIRDAVADRLETWLGPLGAIGRAVAPTVVRLGGRRIGVGEGELRPIDRIGALGAPLLMLAGTADPYTRFGESVALFEHARAPKELWALDGAKHEDLHAFAAAEYERRVGGFLARHLTSGMALGACSGAARAAGPGAADVRRGRASACD